MKIAIFNIYNDGSSEEMINTWKRLLEMQQRKDKRVRTTRLQLWAGDFNHHHPMWDKPRNIHLFTQKNLDKAQELITILAEHKVPIQILPQNYRITPKEARKCIFPTVYATCPP